MKKYIISADIGKFDTKLVGRSIDQSPDDMKSVCMRTKMYDLENGFIDVEGNNSYLVKFDGKTYIVGDQGQDKSEDTSKTNFLHKLTCYTAITQFLEPNTKDNKIYMVLACPLSVLLIPEAKEGYKDFIKGNGAINIAVDNKNYEFEIVDITIKAEGSGIVYLEPNIFKSKAVGIVDLGGLNMGFSLYNNLTCKKEHRFIEECGTDRLIDLVREQLSIYKNGNLVNREIAEKALNEGGLKKAGKIDNESMPFIEVAKEKYFNEVLRHIKEHKFNIDELDEVVFIGGTTQHIKKNISKIQHSYVPTNSQLSTVEGNYKVAFKKYGSMISAEQDKKCETLEVGAECQA